MKLEYQTILRWINQIILKEKIPSSSKIITLLSGGSSVKITLESLKSTDNNLETDNRFLELIGKHFGLELETRVKQLYPILSLILLNRSQEKEQKGGGSNLKYVVLPIVVIIIGYSYIEKIGEDKFNCLVLVCVCFCIYLLVTDESSGTSDVSESSNSKDNTVESDSKDNTVESDSKDKDVESINSKDKAVKSESDIYLLTVIVKPKKIYKYNSDQDYLYINTDNELILNGDTILSGATPNMLFYDLEDDTIYNLDYHSKKILNYNINKKQFIEFEQFINLEHTIEEIKQFKFKNGLIYILFNKTLKVYHKNTTIQTFEDVIDFSISTDLYVIKNNSQEVFTSKNKRINRNKNKSFYIQIIEINNIIFCLDNEKNMLIFIKENCKTIQNVKRLELIKYKNEVYILTSMQDNKIKLYKISNVISIQKIKSEDEIEEKILDVFKNYMSLEHEGGANPTPTDQFGMLSMVTKGIRWVVTNIKSYIKESIDITREWIKSPDKSFETFVILLTKVATGSKSNLSPEILNLYSFNGGTGHIEFLGKLPGRIETILTSKVKFYITYNSKIGQKETKYFFNGLPMDTISYIESRPIATALVIAWVETTNSKHLISPEQIISKSQSKYVFELNSDGRVIIYNRETKAPVQSIQTSIDLWLGSTPIQAKISATQVCKEMFGVETGLDNSTCAQYFYSVLGKSGLTIVKILGKQVESSSDIKSLLLGTNPGIKYEILKKLEWKINSSNKLISFEDWVKSQPIEFGDYFKTKPGLEVKTILEVYIQDVQTHLENDLKQYTNPKQTNHYKRLTSSQVAALRSIQIDQTSKLILPKYFNIQGGVDYKLETKPVTDLETKFNFIKTQLEGGNKIISSNTENKINELIQSVSSLEELNSPLYPAKLIKLNKTFGKLEDYLK